MSSWPSTSVADRSLVVLIDGAIAGSLTRHANNMLRFAYDPGYLADPDATPLSLSMPLSAEIHTDTPARMSVSAFIRGLLPDDPRVIERWGSHFHVPVSSPFGLLGTPVGRDCAGAVSFCPTDELEDHLARGGEVRPIDEVGVAELLRDVKRDPAYALGRSFSGQFSLSGAQGKIALRRSADGRWGQPMGTEPTSHILKPASSGWEDQDINEHLCLDAARRCGIEVARSDILRFDDQQAIVVARFDRLPRDGGGLVRLHQEDLCQASGLPPDRKYERVGGPSVRDIVTLLRRVMRPDGAETAVRRFVDALIFNWVIMGTDAHAKNYSLLLRKRLVRLAPLYDIASILPYLGTRDPYDHEVIHERKQTFAMKLGGRYEVYPVRNVWPKVASQVELPLDELRERVIAIIEAAPGAVAAAAADPSISALDTDLPQRLLEGVDARAAECRRALA